MAQPHRLLTQAFHHYQAARPSEAAAACEAVLKAQPNLAPALHLLGAIRLKQGAAPDAVKLLERAARAEPRNPETLNTLASARADAGDLAGAVETYERAILLKPDYAQALYNQGNALRRLGRPADAVARYRRALDIQHYPHALNNLAMALNELGVALSGKDRHDEALAAFAEALAIRPDEPDIRVNYANALAASGEWLEARDRFNEILADEPGCAAALTGLGNCLKNDGDLGGARACYRRSIASEPSADAWNNIGEVEKHLGNWRDAEAAYDRAAALSPANRDLLFGRALVRLATGRFAGGFADYRARPAIQDASGLTRAPLSADLTGRRVHVRWDQGLGDELFFLRFLPALRARGAWVAYEPDPRLAPILARAGIADHIGPPHGHVDCRVTVGDLPHVLGFADADPAPPSIVLEALPERVAEIRAALTAFGPPPYLAVTWRAGTAGDKKALFKEVGRDALAAALQPYRGTVVAVQRRPQPGEVAGFAAALGRPVLDLCACNDDLEAILALIGGVDGYVCVSNTNVHLRAALGRTSRVLVPNPPEFRWMAQGASPWFPGTPVYRQGVDGDWAAALAQLSTDLS